MLAILRTLGMLDLTHQKILVSICSKLSCLSVCKKSTEQTCYFRYFRHAWPHTPKMKYQFDKTFNVYQQAKNQHHVFLEILQRYCKLVVFGTLGLSDYAHPKWYYQLVENFCVYLQGKKQLYPPCFYGDIAMICKLILGSLGMPVIFTLTQSDSITLQKASMFISMQKMSFIIHFFLTILRFKESCNTIGWQHFGP